MRILIIDEQDIFCETLSEELRKLQYQRDIAKNIKDASYFLKIRNYDLIIVEYKIKEQNVLEFISLIKTTSPKTSIIAITPNYEKMQEIQALRYGADDFLSKPIDLDILLARIDAKLRFKNPNSIKIGDLVIIPKEEVLSFKGEIIDLKGKPFEILSYLILHQDQIVTKQAILDSIWEDPEFVTPNVIEVAINQIRQKLDKAFGIKTIETIRKKGYRFSYPKNTI